MTVTQQHPMGCGVACVAYIAEITYQAALKLFKNPENAPDKGYYCRDIVEALRNLGKNYTYRALKADNKELLSKKNIIVFCAKSKKYPLGHFLAKKDDDLWMNPWANFPIITPAISALEENLPNRATYIIYPL